MLSLRRSIFRNLKPGAIYAAPPVLQQQRARAFQAVAALAETNLPVTRSPSPPFSRFVGPSQVRYQSTNSGFDRDVAMESVSSQATAEDAQKSDTLQQAADLPVHVDSAGKPLPPTKRIYIGNISYGIRAEDLEREFGEFGKVQNARIIYDPRGLSKGFGYVEFEEISAATQAVNKMHGLIVDGRRINVQYVLRPERTDTGFDQNPPSKTLFIGNLSFDITDKDLNELFANVKNCTDVRVAIDRRTGQPRGFAHADFIDIPSAVNARSILEGKEMYGRAIRIDYTKNAAGAGRPSGGRSFLNQ